MSTVLVVTPIVIAHWPVIAAAISAAIASMGFSTVEEAVTAGRSSASAKESEKEMIEVENSEIMPGAIGMAEQMVVERQGVRATFSRDARGALKVCMEGKGLSKRQLRELGEELIGRVTQQFVYNRIVTELKEKNMAVVGEEVSEDRVVRLRVRSW
jgi:hypothetical protein